MFSTNWQTSPRDYAVTIERGVRIPMDDGVMLDCNVYRPDSGGKFPVILAPSPYPLEAQEAKMMPVGFIYSRAFIESGDYDFFARRGYVFVIATIRGAHRSEGVFGNLEPDPRSVEDMVHMVDWAAKQPWSDGNVGMTGVSYFSMMAKRAAQLSPPNLKAIFSLYGFSDGYRDLFYHGGIFTHVFVEQWCRRQSPFFRIENRLKAEWGEEKYAEAIQAMLRDGEINSVPALVAALRNPDAGGAPMLNEIMLNPLDTEYHKPRKVDFARASKVPAYVGADWGMAGLHLPGDVRAYEEWAGPKKMVIGPPLYLDRPAYQYAFEQLRWFDYWLKGVDTEIMEEDPVSLFIVGANEWKSAREWPLLETKWTPFYLHVDGLLSEHEFWPGEGASTYEDSPFSHGRLTFTTPPMVETTEVCGPMVLNLYGSTTDNEILWFVTVLHVTADGEEHYLTRGWLRGSQRKTDPERSKPWQPYHSHDAREPLTPGEIYEFNIEIRPYGIELKPGERLRLQIKSADDETPGDIIEHISWGHVSRRAASHVTVHHNADNPSHLLLPVTRGNRIGTFISGGELPKLVAP